MAPEHRDEPSGPADPVVSRLVIVREPTLLDRFVGALVAASDPTVPAETIVVVAPTGGLAARVRAALPDAVVLTGDVDVGTAAAWNLAAELARGPYLMLLHEDTVVTAGWERGLLDVFSGNDDVGLVGPRLLHRDGTLQNRGWVLCDNGWAVPVDERSAAGRSGPEQLDVDVVSSACLLMPRAHWSAVGGFDEAFFPAVGVDVDLGIATRARGQRVLSTAGVTVVHDSGAMVRSAHAPADDAVRRYLIEDHHGLLARKWAAVVRTCPPFPTDDRSVAAVVDRRLADLARPAVGGVGCPAPDRSITGGETPVGGRVPPEVERRAAVRRARLLEEVLDAALEPNGAPDEDLDVLRDRSARLEAIERSRTWRVRTAVRRALRLP